MALFRSQVADLGIQEDERTFAVFEAFSQNAAEGARFTLSQCSLTLADLETEAQAAGDQTTLTTLYERLDVERQRQAARLAKAQREGKLGNLEAFLNESLGLTEEAAHVVAVEQAALKIIGSTFSVRPVPYADNIEAAFRQKLPPNAILEIGPPGAILKAAGLPEIPLRIRQSKIRKKRGKHSELKLEALKKLPGALNDPMMVYISPGDTKAFSIITTIPTDQGPIAAYFTTREENGETALEAKSIYGRMPEFVLTEMKAAESLELLRYKDEKNLQRMAVCSGRWQRKNDASTQHHRFAEGQVSLLNEHEESQTPDTNSVCQYR
nr:hypothetical protein [Prosthecobacter dejongeii]